jgi:uncharacterized protein (DUF1810 family)
MGPFDLQRFVDAQAPVWEDVRAELGRASKRTHWMWFVFPQLAACFAGERDPLTMQVLAVQPPFLSIKASANRAR